MKEVLGTINKSVVLGFEHELNRFTDEGNGWVKYFEDEFSLGSMADSFF